LTRPSAAALPQALPAAHCFRVHLLLFALKFFLYPPATASRSLASTPAVRRSWPPHRRVRRPRCPGHISARRGAAAARRRALSRRSISAARAEALALARRHLAASSLRPGRAAPHAHAGRWRRNGEDSADGRRGFHGVARLVGDEHPARVPGFRRRCPARRPLAARRRAGGAGSGATWGRCLEGGARPECLCPWMLVSRVKIRPRDYRSEAETNG
jgi:hypothetical protein